MLAIFILCMFNNINNFMLCYVMLCYVMLCYVMLCYVMLCYVMLCALKIKNKTKISDDKVQTT